MPILHGDRLVGRIDPVFDREANILRVSAVYAVDAPREAWPAIERRSTISPPGSAPTACRRDASGGLAGMRRPEGTPVPPAADRSAVAPQGHRLHLPST